MLIVDIIPMNGFYQPNIASLQQVCILNVLPGLVEVPSRNIMHSSLVERADSIDVLRCDTQAFAGNPCEYESSQHLDVAVVDDEIIKFFLVFQTELFHQIKVHVEVVVYLLRLPGCCLDLVI
jgi:hypothetical protein